MSRVPVVWVLTDGKAGDEGPLLGIAAAMGVEPVVRRVDPKPPWVWAMPAGPVPPGDRPDKAGSPVAPPFPDVCLAAGRRTVAYLRALKAASPATLTVFYRDPRTSRHGADLLVAQAHDGLAGANVMTVVTGPHRLSAGRLAAARAAPPPVLATLPPPRVAVLVGGDSRHHRWETGDEARFMAGLGVLLSEGASLMVTTSRRTSDRLVAALAALAGERVFVWNGTGDNPYLAMLALADAVVVTADSTNMIGEAAATGREILLFSPSGGHPKIGRFVAALSALAVVHPFPSALGTTGYPPLDTTPLIADRILGLWRERTGG